MHAFAVGTLLAAQGLFLLGLKIPWAASSNDDGSGLGFGNRNLGTIGEGDDELEPDDKVLLQLTTSTVVRRSYPKLQALPGYRKCRELCIHVLVGHDVERDRSGFSLALVFRHRWGVIDRGLPRHGNESDRTVLDRFGS